MAAAGTGLRPLLVRLVHLGAVDGVVVAILVVAGLGVSRLGRGRPLPGIGGDPGRLAGDLVRGLEGGDRAGGSGRGSRWHGAYRLALPPAQLAGGLRVDPIGGLSSSVNSWSNRSPARSGRSPSSDCSSSEYAGPRSRDMPGPPLRRSAARVARRAESEVSALGYGAGHKVAPIEVPDDAVGHPSGVRTTRMAVWSEYPYERDESRETDKGRLEGTRVTSVTVGPPTGDLDEVRPPAATRHTSSGGTQLHSGEIGIGSSHSSNRSTVTGTIDYDSTTPKRSGSLHGHEAEPMT